MTRVWVDVTNTAHVVVLRPLVELLEARGVEVAVTARPLSHTVELLEDWGHPFRVLGAYGGVRRADKARAAADRVRRMVGLRPRQRPVRRRARPRSTDLPVAARLLGVPNTTMFDYEFALAQHHLNCRTADRVLVPDAIPPERLAGFGARPPSSCATRASRRSTSSTGFAPDAGVVDALGSTARAPLAVVRTAPSYAALPRVAARRRSSPGCGATSTGRARRRSSSRAPPTSAPTSTRSASRASSSPSARSRAGRSSPFADVLVSAGGSMNREAAALGTPVWSMFEGRLGGVDERLVEEGRLRLLRDPAEVVLAGAGRGEARRPPSTRDPAGLLDLALGGWLPA
jgi:predicted glycosyltransferase